MLIRTAYFNMSATYGIKWENTDTLNNTVLAVWPSQ